MRIVLRFLTIWACLWLVTPTARAAPATTAKPPEKTKTAPVVVPEMRFMVMRDSNPKCEPDCPEWISAEGKIMPGTAAKLAKLLNNPKLRSLPLVLNSSGGDIGAALAMGRLLRKYRMDTAVGQSLVFSCPNAGRVQGVCKADTTQQAFDGIGSASRAYCASACPLILMGGVHRIVDPISFVGLHEPIGWSQPAIDHYWVKWRIVKGKKHIISKTFVNRTYLAKKTVIGITPKLNVSLTSYLNEMGGSLDILVEMKKAAPKDMNWISYASHDRERLGLVTANFRSLDSLIGVYNCFGKTGLAINCVHMQEREPFVMKPFER